MNIKILVSGIFIVFLPVMGSAGISGEVEKWFNDQNYANVTPAGSFKSQAGRMYTGGGISTRTSVEPIGPFLSVQSPRISGGCGGIDIYTGGFTHIDADQFVDSLKAIGKNAKSLAFMMALKIASSQFETTIGKIKGWADRFNQFQTDSCSAASKLIGFGVKQAGWLEGCIALRQAQFGEDRSKAQYNCTTNGKAGSTMDSATHEQKNKITFIDGNLTWHALMQDPYFRNDLDMAELIMNIVGTMIVDKGTGADPNPKIVAQIPNVIGTDYESEKFKNIFNAMYLGKSSGEPLKLVKCQNKNRNLDACKTVTSHQNVPVTWEGMKPRVDILLASITKKVKNGTPDLNAQEKGLIESTTLPIFRFISAATASETINYVDGDNPAEQFSDIVAREVVYRNLKNLIEKVEFRIENDKQNLSNSDDFKKFSKQVKDVLKGITQLQKQNANHEKTLRLMVDEIQKYERQILSKVHRPYIEAARFGN